MRFKLAVCNVIAVVRHILPISMICASAFASADVCKPSRIESSLAPPWEMTPVFINGGFYGREFFGQDVNNGDLIFRPLCGSWIQTSKLGHNSIPETSAGVFVRDKPLNLERSEERDKGDDDVNVPGHDWFLLVLPLLILWMSGCFRWHKPKAGVRG